MSDLPHPDAPNPEDRRLVSKKPDLSPRKPDEPHVYVEGPGKLCLRCRYNKYKAQGHWRKG